MVAAEGRQAGMYLMLALQDPTAKSIDLRIRRNCTCVAFKVQDQDASRVVLGAAGAEVLIPGHFMTVIGSLQHGVGFEAPHGPDDTQLTQFLGRTRVIPLPPPSWIQDAEYTEVGESKEEKILRLYREGASMAEIQRQVCGFTGGAAYNEVRQVILSNTTNDTTTTQGESGYVNE
jgi:DNA segregation ATPase FtsK/SpoIIIE-like protein